MKHPKLSGVIYLLALFPVIYGQPVVSGYDVNPYPIGGYENLSQQVISPLVFRLCNWETTVKLSIQIEADGQVSNIQVIQSGGEAFDQAAIQGVSAVDWQPARLDDEAVPVILEIPFQFCQP